MTDGIINLDSVRGKELGFVSADYDGYLWKRGDTIMVSFIVSNAKGNFRRLVERIHAAGYAVEIPTPLGRMEQIVCKNGYKCRSVYDPDMDAMGEVWRQEPERVTS